MSTYIIGDVHGCYQSLLALLGKIQFNPKKDKLIFVGDLINRGPDSLSVLRFVKSLGDSAVVVLGNHDISFIAYMAGVYHGRGTDFPKMALAKDSTALSEWLRNQPLLHQVLDLNYLVVHAAIPPEWSIEKATQRARKAEKKLRGENYKKYLRAAYQPGPTHWKKCQTKRDKFRYTVNGLTRLRYCDAKGGFDLSEKAPPRQQKKGLLPWFESRQSRQDDQATQIVFGHWAALGYHQYGNSICIDSGCVWGNRLTALKITPDGYLAIHKKR
ncbi:symmetrical bis(5'-nucleosyl)-tetraphosphatase [Ostreibacterium oceani]|nr:symmetrical bis(5'-nucleosyl)-tetraphosphatase [Ostreibacterium oceani]